MISGEMETLGTVVNANAAVCSIFGRTSTELVGSNVNIVIPEPYGSIHGSYLQGFLEKGTSKVMDKIRYIFALHKNGYIVPIALLPKKVPRDMGKIAFLGVISEVKTDDHYCFVDPNTGIITRYGFK